MEKLRIYKEKNGNCDVPQRYEDDPGLGVWCGNQRPRKRTDKLSPEKIQRLDKLGFCWYPKEESWEESFEKLRIYKEKNGNCDVPQKHKSDPALGQWVGVQRRSRDIKVIKQIIGQQKE